MYIKLQNVGAIDEATVDLTGLSVIAGKMELAKVQSARPFML